MAADDSKTRIADAISLFNWGFANCRLYTDENADVLPAIPLTGGKQSSLPICYSGSFRYLDTSGSSENLSKTLDLPESLEAPVTGGDAVGKALYFLGETQVGEVDILAAETVERLTFRDSLRMLSQALFLGNTAEIFT